MHKSRLCSLERIFLCLVVFLWHQRPQQTAHAWTLPRRIRLDQDGTPRLAKLVGQTVGLTTRVVMGAAYVDNMTVKVQASSNRQVLRGSFESLQLDARNLQGPWLHMQELHLGASSISLGKWPLALLVAPWVILKLRRLLFWTALVAWIYPSVWSKIRRQASPWAAKLNGEPWSLDYNAVVTQNGLERSRLLQLALKAVLRSLMLNSVLGMAAAAGDAMTQIQNDAKSQLPPNNPQLRLGPSFSSSSPSTSAALFNQQQQEPMLTKLFEATSFSLTNAELAKQGRLLLFANAHFENSAFYYTLRVTPQTIVIDGKSMLVFASPECCFETSALVGGGPLGQLLPNLWIPVGPGVGLELGNHHEISKIKLLPEVWDNPGSLVGSVTGRILFFQKVKPPGGFGASVGDNFPCPLPFSTRNSLPPGKRKS